MAQENLVFTLNKFGISLTFKIKDSTISRMTCNLLLHTRKPKLHALSKIFLISIFGLGNFTKSFSEVTVVTCKLCKQDGRVFEHNMIYE